MHNARPIASTEYNRGSHPPLRRSATHGRLQLQSPPAAPEVLYCQPLQLQRGRGKPLQFQSFDEAYVERLRAGDFRTQEHFVAYFSELISIKARNRLRSAEAVEDVRQETFVRVFTALRDRKIIHAERLGPFVNSTCKFVLMEYVRRVTRDGRCDGEEHEEIPDESIDLTKGVLIKQLSGKIGRVLDQLSERDRRLLREVFVDERDKDEVCRDFGVTRDHLRLLLYRAKKAFKSLYLDKQDEPPAAVIA